MAEFFNTGMETEFVTLILVVLGILITSILVLGVYHLQKPRPKLKIKKYSSSSHHETHVRVNVNVQNIGDKIAEEVKYEMTSMTKGVTLIEDSSASLVRDLDPTSGFMTETTVNIKTGEKCKIKLKVSWDNHTFKLKKRNSLTHEFTCTRTEVHVTFEENK